MLEREFQYFQDHQDELAARFSGRFIVIVGDEIIGDYESRDEAYAACSAEHEVGTFLIQRADRGEGAITNTFCSRVYA